jgi:glutamate synthase (NADPH/NADH) small chain
LRYGIPDFKIEKHVVERRIAVMEAEGVVFRCGTRVDDWAGLRAEHDAVVVAIGAERPRDLDVPGRALAGVVIAMDYLIDQNAGGGKYDVRGKHVIILGGGDTGSDCLGTAHRQRAASVRQIELMPAPPTVRTDDNPWPTWPVVFRTSSSQEEGGARDFAFRTARLEGEAGRIARLIGRREDTGEEVTLPCETLILALGFLGPHTRDLTDQLGIARDARGNIAVDGTFATSIPGVFCAGDAHRGASLVVWAIAEGRDCAKHVDAYLRGR